MAISARAEQALVEKIAYLNARADKLEHLRLNHDAQQEAARYRRQSAALRETLRDERGHRQRPS